MRETLRSDVKQERNNRKGKASGENGEVLASEKMFEYLICQVIPNCTEGVLN